MPDCPKIDCCPPLIYGYQPSFEATATFTALCPVGQTGDPVTVSKTATSLISKQDAYNIALAEATEEANDALVCEAPTQSLRLLSIQDIITSQGDFIDPTFTLVNQTILNDTTFDGIGIDVSCTNVDVVNPQSFGFEATIGLTLEAVGSWQIEFEPNSPATLVTNSVSHSTSDHSYELVASISGDLILTSATVTGTDGGPASDTAVLSTTFTITDETQFFVFRILIGVDDLSPVAVDSAFASIRIICTKV